MRKFNLFLVVLMIFLFVFAFSFVQAEDLDPGTVDSSGAIPEVGVESVDESSLVVKFDGVNLYSGCRDVSGHPFLAIDYIQSVEIIGSLDGEYNLEGFSKIFSENIPVLRFYSDTSCQDFIGESSQLDIGVWHSCFEGSTMADIHVGAYLTGDYSSVSLGTQVTLFEGFTRVNCPLDFLSLEIQNLYTEETYDDYAHQFQLTHGGTAPIYLGQDNCYLLSPEFGLTTTAIGDLEYSIGSFMEFNIDDEISCYEVSKSDSCSGDSYDVVFVDELYETMLLTGAAITGYQVEGEQAKTDGKTNSNAQKCDTKTVVDYNLLVDGTKPSWAARNIGGISNLGSLKLDLKMKINPKTGQVTFTGNLQLSNIHKKLVESIKEKYEEGDYDPFDVKENGGQVKNLIKEALKDIWGNPGKTNSGNIKISGSVTDRGNMRSELKFTGSIRKTTGGVNTNVPVNSKIQNVNLDEIGKLGKEFKNTLKKFTKSAAQHPDGRFDGKVNSKKTKEFIDWLKLDPGQKYKNGRVNEGKNTRTGEKTTFKEYLDKNGKVKKIEYKENMDYGVKKHVDYKTGEGDSHEKPWNIIDYYLKQIKDAKAGGTLQPEKPPEESSCLGGECGPLCVLDVTEPCDIDWDKDCLVASCPSEALCYSNADCDYEFLEKTEKGLCKENHCFYFENLQDLVRIWGHEDYDLDLIETLKTLRRGFSVIT